jgi:futalosine hydrolase
MRQLLVIPTLAEAEQLIADYGFKPTNQPALFERSASCSLFICGIGTLPVVFNLSRHLAENRYDRLIHAGVAGSFFRNLQPGEVVEVTRDTFADYGIDHDGIFRWIFHEGLWNPDEAPFRNGWLEVPADPQLNLQRVSAVTVDLVTGSEQRKQHLINKFNPHIETMEGAAVLYVCARMGMPAVQIRGISNHTGTRDRLGWKIREAIDAFTRELSVFL